MDWLETSYLGNTVGMWLTSAGMFVAIWLGLAILPRLVARRLEGLAARTSSGFDDAIVYALRGTKFTLMGIVALYVASSPLELGETPQRALEIGALLAALMQLAIGASRGIGCYTSRYKTSHLEHGAASATTMSAVGYLARVLVWSVVMLIALDNLGFDITALIAGLGIGGIAVALALQNVLGDLFASLSIVLDKPFVIGDFIIVGDYMGSIDSIGIKSTRIRGLGGEQIVFNNSDLLSSRIRNYRRMDERRVVFRVGVTYETQREQLEQIPDLLRNVIESTDETRFDRAHFASFGDYSLDFEIVYYVLSRDYNVYMDAQQTINFAIHARFAERGIEFAYPTRRIFADRTEDGNRDEQVAA